MNERGTILIVDDNKNNQELCRLCLQRENYKFFFADNGNQGLQVAKQIHPDLILCDIMMPVMDGYQMLESLKADPDIKDIPVIIMTALTETFNLVKAFQLGANDFLRKPFIIDEFIARVDALVRQKKSADVIITESCRAK